MAYNFFKIKQCVKSVRIYSAPHFPSCGQNTERKKEQFVSISVFKKYKSKHILHNFVPNVEKHPNYCFYLNILTETVFVCNCRRYNTLGLNGKYLASKTFYRGDIV